MSTQVAFIPMAPLFSQECSSTSCWTKYLYQCTNAWNTQHKQKDLSSSSSVWMVSSAGNYIYTWHPILLTLKSLSFSMKAVIVFFTRYIITVFSLLLFVLQIKLLKYMCERKCFTSNGNQLFMMLLTIQKCCYTVLKCC